MTSRSNKSRASMWTTFTTSFLCMAWEWPISEAFIIEHYNFWMTVIRLSCVILNHMIVNYSVVQGCSPQLCLFPGATFSISGAQLDHKTAMLTNKLSGLWQSCSMSLIMLLMSLMLLTMPRTKKGMTFEVACHVYQLSRILTFCHSCCVKYR